MWEDIRGGGHDFGFHYTSILFSLVVQEAERSGRGDEASHDAIWRAVRQCNMGDELHESLMITLSDHAVTADMLVCPTPLPDDILVREVRVTRSICFRQPRGCTAVWQRLHRDGPTVQRSAFVLAQLVQLFRLRVSIVQFSAQPSSPFAQRPAVSRSCRTCRP